MQTNDPITGSGNARRRALILTALIVIVTLFWVVLLYFTDLPTLALAGIGVLSILTLSVATAWTAMAVPRNATEDSG